MPSHDVMMTFWVPEDYRARMRAASEVSGKSMSEIIRRSAGEKASKILREAAEGSDSAGGAETRKIG